MRIFLLAISNQVCCVSHRAAAELLQYLLSFIGHIKSYVFSDLHIFLLFSIRLKYIKINKTLFQSVVKQVMEGKN